jgi:hypothetical protein
MRKVRRICILLIVQAVQEIRRFRKLMRVNQAAMPPAEITVVHTAPWVLRHRMPVLHSTTCTATQKSMSPGVLVSMYMALTGSVVVAARCRLGMLKNRIFSCRVPVICIQYRRNNPIGGKNLPEAGG